MTYRTRYGTVLVAILLIISNLPGFMVAGSSTRLVTFVTYPDQEYCIGSAVMVDVHVLRDGEHVDPDRIEFKAGESLYKVPVVKQGTGLYRASLVIEEGEMDGPRFYFEAHSWKDGEWAPTGDSVYVSDRPVLEVRVFIDDPTDITPVLGQTVDFVVKTLSLGKCVDPDAGSLKAFVKLDRTTSMDVELTRVSMGMYRGAFEVQDDWWRFIGCSIFAQATLTTGGFVSSDESNFIVAVRTFDVWYRCNRINNTYASFDIHVLDLSGNPLPGAFLNLTSRYLRIDGVKTEVGHNLTCDADGRARLELVFDNVGSWNPTSPVLSFVGTVSFGGLCQNIQGLAIIPGGVMLDQEDPSGFNVARPDDSFLPMGLEANLTYLARFDGVPLANHNISGYIYGDHGIYWHGNLTTDMDGSFNIRLTTPVVMDAIDGEAHLSTRFITWVNGSLFDTWSSTGLILRNYNRTWQARAEMDPTTYFQVTGEPGDREFQMGLVSEGVDGVDETAYVLWGVGSVEDFSMDNGENIKYIDNGVSYLYYGAPVPISWSDGAYRGTLRVPSFVPPGVNLYAVGFIAFYEGMSIETRYAYLSNISALLIDLPPSVRIESPVNGSIYRGEVLAAGTATDDHGVRTVMVRFDGGNWTRAAGTTAWSLQIGMKGLDDGHHTLEAISYDGLMYSPVVRVEFETSHEAQAGEGSWLWLVLVIIVIVTLIGTGLFLYIRNYQDQIQEDRY